MRRTVSHCDLRSLGRAFLVRPCWGIALQRLGLVACLFYGCTSQPVREPPRPRPVSGRLGLSGFVVAECEIRNFGDEFLRLERAGIQLLTPETFRSERGLQFSSRIDEIRRELGEALPEQPTAYTRKVRRSIKRDIARELYRTFDIRLDKH
jgi:hypothetical protein